MAATAAILIFMPGGQSEYVEIYRDGQLVRRADINDDARIAAGQNMVAICNGEVSMEDADCPDRLCVKSGAISKAGQMIVCLPNKIIVKIV